MNDVLVESIADRVVLPRWVFEQICDSYFEEEFGDCWNENVDTDCREMYGDDVANYCIACLGVVLLRQLKGPKLQLIRG